MANEFIARKGLIVSGSTNISGSVTAHSYTGSLFGTSSWSSRAISSSYALTASYALNAANAGGGSATNLTIIQHEFIGDGTTTGYILSSSYDINSIIVTVDGLTFTPIEDYSLNTTNLSFVTAPPSASTIYVRAFINVTSGSVGSFSGSFLGSITSASIATTASLATTSSFAVTASYALNAQSGGSGAGFPFSGSAVITGSLQVLDTGSVGGITGSMTGSFKGDGSELINLNLNSAVVSDVYKFVSDGTTSIYTLSQSYLESNVQVNVQGLAFTNGVDYNYTTGSISFVLTPPSSSNILVHALLNTQTNLSGSFSGSFIGDGRGLNNIPLAINIEANKYTGDGSTTTYSLGYPYGPNSLFVTVNGVTFISPEDFSTSASNIIFVETPPSESNILVRAFVTQSGVASASLASTASYVEYTNVGNKPTLVSSSIQINTGSFSGSFIGTSSWASNAVTASNALTASFALNAQSGGSGAGFPFSGSAIITGSLEVINTGSVGGITGSFSGSGAGLHDLRSSLALDTYNFIGDGTTINYVLSQSYTPNSLFVSVEGINYTYIEDFTLSSNTLTFVVAPPTQSNVSVRALLSVSSGSYINYTGSFIGDGYGLDNLRGALAIETNKFIGDGVTTQYTLSSSYSPQSMLVTVGGLRYIDANDYSLTGSTLNFVQAPASQSVIVAQAYLIISSGSVGTFSGSFLGNATTATSASYATTASFASNVLKTKAGSIVSASFGGTPLSASVTFGTAFNNTNYSVAVTGEDVRIFTVQSKTAGGFVVNTNSNTALTGTTYWTCTAYGEN